MTGYEQDFIYKVIPRLSKAIEGLTEELKRFNDNAEKANKNDDVKTEEEKV